MPEIMSGIMDVRNNSKMSGIMSEIKELIGGE